VRCGFGKIAYLIGLSTFVLCHVVPGTLLALCDCGRKHHRFVGLKKFLRDFSVEINMNMKLKTLAVAFAALTVSVGANAGIVDLFDDGDQLYVGQHQRRRWSRRVPPRKLPGAPISYATILGGNRDLIVEKLSDGGIPNNVSRNASKSVSPVGSSTSARVR
jgi:hypothetical protein